MAGAKSSTRFRFWLWLIRLIGVLVPGRLRHDWRQEWEAELQWRQQQLAEWDKLDARNKRALLWHSAGAFADALWLQPKRWEDEMLQDLRFGVRMLLKNPGFALIAIITLSLGIGANTAIFSVVNAVLLRPLPYPESERLMQVGRVIGGGSSVYDLSEPKFVFLRDHAQSFAALSTATGMGATLYLADESQAEYIDGLRVTADFFRVLGVQPMSGRGFTAAEDSPAGEHVVVLSDGFWRRRYGADAGMIGRTIKLNDFAYTVVGIMPPGFEYAGAQDVFVPMRVNRGSQNEGHNWPVIGRLQPGVTPEQARAELQLLFDKFRATSPRLVQANENFSAQNWRAQMTTGVRELLGILLGAVGCVLLIACANVANLQLTRAAARQKEMAIRMALGAGGARLLRQLLTEGIVLAWLGGGLGLLLALWGMKALLAILPAGLLPRAGEVNLDRRVLAFAVITALLTGIVSSLAPAWQALRVDVNRALKEGRAVASAGAAHGRLRGLLVVAEIALALTLTVGAGLLLRTFANLREMEPGFATRNVLSFDIALRGKSYDSVAKLQDFYSRALERFRSLPGVEAAALTNMLPLNGRFNLPYKLAGQSQWSGSTEYRLISPDYFHVMKMSARQGRSFNDGDAAGAEPVIIINEALAQRSFSGVDPIGQQLCAGCEYGDPALRRVIGVVNDTKQRNLREAAPSTVFIPLPQASEGVRQLAQQASFVLRTTNDPAMLSAAIRAQVRQLDPNTPIRNLRSLEQLMSRSVAPERFNLSLLGLFAGLGLLLAAVGIYGVMAYRVAQRTHELGIRLALGAQPRDVLWLVIRQGMTLTLLGVAIGLLASFGLTRWLKSLLFGVSATDPLTFAALTVLLICIALLACYLPARKAMKVDPLIALRHE